MAACDKSTPGECKTEVECNGLNKEGGAKYSFNASSATAKCMLADSSVATKCVEGNDSNRSLNSKTDAGSPAADTGKNATTK